MGAFSKIFLFSDTISDVTAEFKSTNLKEMFYLNEAGQSSVTDRGDTFNGNVELGVISIDTKLRV